MAVYVGVDLGATNIRAVVADGSATILGSATAETPRGPTGIVITEAILDAIRAACGQAGVTPGTATACGIGAIGPLDLAAGAVENPANLPDRIDRIPLTGPISKLLTTEDVYLHNDTIAGVIGERFHSERNPDDMVYLTISSGIGAGVCVDGTVIAGWDGNAGEVVCRPCDRPTRPLERDGCCQHYPRLRAVGRQCRRCGRAQQPRVGA